MRAHLDEEAMAVREQGARGLLEPDRLAEVAVPVGRVELAAVDPRPRHGGVERDPGRGRLDARERCPERLFDALDMGAVGGVVDAHLAGEELGRGELLEQRVGCVGVARDDGGAGAVHRGDGEPPPEALEPLLDVAGRQLDRDHRAATRQPRQRTRAERDDLRRVLERERARHAGGGDLPLAVAHHGVGLDAHGAPQRSERDHHREEHGLDHVDALERGSALLAAQHREERPVDVRRERALAGLDPRAEHVGGLEQRTRHLRPLRALAGEDEDDLARAEVVADGGAGGRSALGERGEGVEQLLAAVGDEARSPLEVRAGGGERVGDVLELEIRMGDEVLAEPLRLRPQRRLAPAREQHGEPRPRIGNPLVRRGLARLGRGRLLEDHVGVRAGDAEGGDAGAARGAVALPRCRLAEEADRPGRPVDVASWAAFRAGARAPS